jgi:hypothetical protein
MEPLHIVEGSIVSLSPSDLQDNSLNGHPKAANFVKFSEKTPLFPSKQPPGPSSIARRNESIHQMNPPLPGSLRGEAFPKPV